jgi:hypothetical protein
MKQAAKELNVVGISAEIVEREYDIFLVPGSESNTFSSSKS